MSSSVPVIRSKLAAIDTLRKSLHGNFLISIFIRGGAAIVALGANVLLARVLGVSEYGRYMAFYSASIVLSGLAVQGTSSLLTRELAAADTAQSRWRTELVRWIRRRVVLGLLVAFVLYVFWSFLIHVSGSGWDRWLADLAALLLIALSVICTLIVAGLNGFGASQRSQSLVPLINNGTVLVFLLIISLGVGDSINSTAALWFQTIGYAGACWLGWYWLRGLSSRAVKRGGEAVPRSGGRPDYTAWRVSSRYFFAVTIAAVVANRLDVVLVSTLVGDHTAGIYVAGARLAQVALLVAVSVNTVLSPRIARAWSQGDCARSWRLVRSGILFTLPTSAVEVLVAVVFSADIIKVFGSSYAESGSVFVLVVVAYALWTLAAPGYALLSMAGSEKIVAGMSWLVAVVNVASIVILVPIYGAIGGGYGMVAGFAVVLPVLGVAMRKKLKYAVQAG